MNNNLTKNIIYNHVTLCGMKGAHNARMAQKLKGFYKEKVRRIEYIVGCCKMEK